MIFHTIANYITFTRLCCIPLYMYLITHNYFGCGFFLYCLILATDSLDGYIARKYNCISQIGSALDPLVDKILIISAYHLLYWNNIIPQWFLIMMYIKEISLIIITMIWFFKRLPIKPIGAQSWGKIAMILHSCFTTYLFYCLFVIQQHPQSTLFSLFFYSCTTATALSFFLYSQFLLKK